MALPTQQRCRSSRFQPYTGAGPNTGAVSRYHAYKAINPFMWPLQEHSKRSWWGPSVFGPPWWAYLPHTASFPCSVVALVRTTHASIGIIRHFVGFLARCKNTGPAQEEDRGGTNNSNDRCGRPGHDHSNEPPFCLSRFWLSTEMGMNPNKQDTTFLCMAGPRTAEIQTVVLGPSVDGTTIDAETGEVALLSRDGESGETVLVSAVRDLTREIILTQSLYEIDIRRQYFSDPIKYGYLLRELDLLSQPPSRRLIRRLDSSACENASGAGQDILEAIPVDAEQLLQICSAYGFSEAETRRVLEHFTYVQRHLEAPRASSGEHHNDIWGVHDDNSSDLTSSSSTSSSSADRAPSFSAALSGGLSAPSLETLERLCVNISPSFGPLPFVSDGLGGDAVSRDPSCQIAIADDDVANGGDAVAMETDGGAAGADFLTRHEAFLSVSEDVPVQWIDEGGGEEGAGGENVPFDADSGESW